MVMISAGDDVARSKVQLTDAQNAARVAEAEGIGGDDLAEALLEGALVHQVLHVRARRHAEVMLAVGAGPEVLLEHRLEQGLAAPVAVPGSVGQLLAAVGAEPGLVGDLGKAFGAFELLPAGRALGPLFHGLHEEAGQHHPQAEAQREEQEVTPRPGEAPYSAIFM